MKNSLAILFLLALAACSNPTDKENQAKAQALTLKQPMDKANAVQQQIFDAEARRRETEEKTE